MESDQSETDSLTRSGDTESHKPRKIQLRDVLEGIQVESPVKKDRDDEDGLAPAGKSRKRRMVRL